LHTTRILRLTENLPIKIQSVESPEKVDELLPKLHEMVGTGLSEIQDTIVAKPYNRVIPSMSRPANPYDKL
jgi:PII-like signaling protein